MSGYPRGKTMKRIVFTVAGMILFIGILSGILIVLSNITRPLSTVITSTECDPPCWYGIWPGETTSWGATSILLNLPGVSSIGEGTRDLELNRITWKFHRPLGDAFGSTHIKDDRVISISLTTVGSLTISDAFQRLGEPELVFTRVYKSSSRKWVKMILIYPADGYQVEADINLPFGTQDNQVEINADTPVYRVIYFDPSQYEYLVEGRVLINGLGKTAIDDARPWQGFGGISYELR